MVKKNVRKPKTLASGEIRFTPDQIPSVTGGRSPAADFSAALLRGDPRAEELLRKAGVGPDYEAIQTNPPKEEASLADMFIAETYNLPKRLGLRASQAKRIEPILQSYRNDIRKAHRFVLDKEFVRYVTELSSTTRPEKMLSRVQYATLPYEVVWVEFDLRTKVEVMHRVHGVDNKNFDWDGVAERLGLIIKRLSPTEAIVEMVCETYGAHGLIGTTICYFFSARDHIFTPDDGKGMGCRPFLGSDLARALQKAAESGRNAHLIEDAESMAQLAAASLWGYMGQEFSSKVIERLSDIKALRLPSFLTLHGVLGTGRMRAILEALIPDAGTYAVENTIANLMLQEMTEFTGMCRWICTVLACLNEVPIATQHIAPEGRIRTGLTSKRPLMDYHKITLRVPKLNPVKFLERQLSPGRKRRAHMVRSHWRNYLRENYCNFDQHEWEYDEEHDYRLCGKCLSESTLIREHQRGDPSLGWVRSDYVVKPAKQE